VAKPILQPLPVLDLHNQDRPHPMGAGGPCGVHQRCGA
jgi:hypothetical protein